MATLIMAAAITHAQTAPSTSNSTSANSIPITLNPNPTSAALPTSLANSASGPDIHDIHSLAPLTFWERNGMLIIYSSIGGVILLSLTIWLFLRKKPIKPLTPYELALKELNFARALPFSSRHQVFAIAASDAVRHYLENAYKMPAPERTTEEFLQEAAHHAWMQGELAGLLRRFLEFCDLAKFAGQELGTTERDQLLSAAREFVDAAEKLRQPTTPSTLGPQSTPKPPVENAPEPTLTTP